MELQPLASLPSERLRRAQQRGPSRQAPTGSPELGLASHQPALVSLQQVLAWSRQGLASSLPEPA